MGGVLKYLSFRGRANRKRYWLTSLALFGIFLLSMAVTFGVSGLLPFGGILLLPLVVGYFVAAFATAARRLHDRNKSAWWLLLLLLLPVVLSIPAELASYSDDAGFKAVAALLALIGLPFSIWAFVELGCLKGTAGPNKYGDDPLEPQVQEVFA
jgi:uncharacterized membrane protein YhaH (DUF805 family)